MNDVLTNFFLWLYALDDVSIHPLFFVAFGIVLVAVSFWQMLKVKDRPPLTNDEFMFNTYVAIGIFGVIALILACLPTSKFTLFESSDIFYLGKLWYY